MNSYRKSYIRAKIILDLINDVARTNGPLLDKISTGSFVSALDEHEIGDVNDINASQGNILPGGLTKSDLKYTTALSINIDDLMQKRLVDGLNATITNIQEFLWGNDDIGEEGSRLERFWRLPDDIQAHLNELSSNRLDAEDQYKQIRRLVDDINEIHPRLQAELTHALTTISPAVNNKRTAATELIVTTIETSLLKFSLLRAQAHRALYSHTPSPTSQATMTQAYSVVYGKLKKEAQKMEEEERVLDEQLVEYQRLLTLVEGPSGGFSQVVEDWSRIQKETEECRRDLRRLGWTGD